MKQIAVFFGGSSNEREISVITGVYAVNLLRGAGYSVLPVYLKEDDTMTLNLDLKKVEDVLNASSGQFVPVMPVRGALAYVRKPKKQFKIDCALNCCHGGLGEGGGLSALLEFYRIPSASPKMCESAVFLDKSISKIALRGLNIEVVPSFTLREEDYSPAVFEQVEREFSYPVIVKPALLGSSIGICVAHDESELKNALSLCFKLCSKALIEQYLPDKRDLNCAAYRKDGKIVLSPVEEVFSGGQLLSFQEKYEGGERKSALPADLPEEIERKIKDDLTKVYREFGVQGIVRADFLLSGEKLYFNELNTVPGSLAAYLFGDSLISAKALLSSLVEEALCSNSMEKELLSSGILTRTRFGGKIRK